jgi:cytoskeletal protein RodZ
MVTRVSLRYLEALESGRFSQLPAKVFTRGFVSSISLHLGLDPEKTSAAFSHVYDNWLKEESQVRRQHETRTGVVITSSAPRRSLSYRTTIAGWSLALLLALMTAGYALLRPEAPSGPSPERTTGGAPESRSSSSSGVDALGLPPAIAANSVAISPPPPLQPAVETQSAGAAPIAVDGLTLTLSFKQDCWTEVMVDGKVAVAELCRGGTVREFRGGQKFVLTLGNAGGVAVTVDGRQLTALGNVGQVVRDFVIDQTSVKQTPIKG